MSVTVRALTGEQHRAIEAARLVAVESAPYLAHALFTMRPVAADGLGTLAVDRHWRLYADPACLADWTPTTLGGVLVHEVSHLVREHAERADALVRPLAPVLWNYATDAAINDDLIEAGIALPDGVVTPEGLDLAPGGIEESYYAALVGNPPPGSEDTAPDDGEGCGPGAGDPTPAWALPGDHDQISPAVPEADADAVRRRVAEAVAEAARSGGRGSVPAGWQRWAEATLRPPTVPWQRVLGAAVRRAVTWKLGRGDYTYARPGRRRTRRVIMPSTRRPVVTVAAVIDTSGSMSADQLADALGEVEGIIAAAGHPQGLTVLTCDAEVAVPVTVRTAREVTLTGGGGTDMTVGITAAEALRPAPDVIVVLTDGYTPWPSSPTRARLIVAITGDGAHDAVPGWANVVSIPSEPT